MGDLSPHFSRAEFVSHDGTYKPPPAAFVAKLEDLRRRIGRPLPILSGYRSPADNRRVGGARSSRHLLGDAADVPVGLVHIDTAVACGFGGIGVHGGWVVHVDDRPARRPVIFDDRPR